MGAASFEGLFVKNLENVQGDERDHMIISTTYGPQKDGKFYQRFGPLAAGGGGRRLNVLVTRARQEVHLVTSIPAELYRACRRCRRGKRRAGRGCYMRICSLPSGWRRRMRRCGPKARWRRSCRRRW